MNSHTAVSFQIWYPTLGGTGVKELKKKTPVIESFKSSLKPAS
jgi:hypothetical protein